MAVKSKLAPTGPGTDWRFQDLIEIVPAAVYVCDAEAIVVAYNRRAAELWGHEPALGDTDEKCWGAHRLYRPDGTPLPQRETPMERLLRTGEPARDREVIIERPGGSRITVLVNIAPLFADDGALLGAVNCFQDLTAQKQAERERARLADELHQTKKIEALGQLTAGVAHDFNNLLTAMLGNLDLLRKRMLETDSLRLLDNAIRLAQRGAELNGHLLGFARKRTAPPEAVDLNQLLARMSDLLRTSIGDAIRIEARLGRDTWPTLVDPGQIELVILNLAINARDAMPFGGLLTFKTRNVTFGARNRPTDLSAGDYAALSISDTGTGMTEEVRAKAFEPFFTTKGPGKGSGLGLSLAFDVARQSGGGIRINSRPGEGTSIDLYLPRADVDASAPNSEMRKEKREPAGAPLGRGRIVLVVDDDGDVRETIVAMLDSLGCSALEADSGTAALQVLESQAQVDLLLIDVGMPHMNGIEVMRRARERRPDLPVMLSTGYADVACFGGDGIDPSTIICKPYRQDELLEKIRACVEPRRKRPRA